MSGQRGSRRPRGVGERCARGPTIGRPGTDEGDAAMALWDAEVEALRPRINEEVAGLLALFPPPSGEFDDAALATVRAMFTPVLSDEGVDRSIPGPRGDIRLRTFAPAGAAEGVMLNIHGGAWVMGTPQMNDLA